MVHNSTMKLVCFDLVVWKLWDLQIDFVLGPDSVALCYELGLKSCNVGFSH